MGVPACPFGVIGDCGRCARGPLECAAVELVGPLAAALTKVVSRTTVTGVEHLPFTGPALVIANHTTIVDVAPVLGMLHRAGLRPSRPCGSLDCGVGHGHVRFLATERAFRNWVVGPLARHAGFISVARRRSAADALRAALVALEEGAIVAIYPEGDVSATVEGAPRELRAGAAWLALRVGCPVIPVAQRDARAIGHGSVLRSLAGAASAVLRRPAVRLHIDEPIRADDYTGLSRRAVTELFRDRLTAAWQRAGRSPGQPVRPPRHLSPR